MALNEIDKWDYRPRDRYLDPGSDSDSDMSWKGPHSPSFTIQSNVPDYQKMLQSQITSSSGWSDNRLDRTSDRYGLHSSPHLTSGSRSNDISYTDRRMYQTYQPSKYGLSGSPGYDSYMNRDFNEFTTGPLEETVNPVNLEDPLRPSGYTPSSYDLKKFDDELFGRSGKSNFLDGSGGNDSELNLDTPNTVNDSWISPPMRQTAKSELPPSDFKTPVRHNRAGILRDTSKYNDEKLNRGNIAVPSSETQITNSNHNSGWADRNNVDHGKTGPAGLGQWQKQHQNHMAFRNTEAQKSQGLATLFKHLSDDQLGSDKWESVRRAADAIINEKDMMIDKLKLRMMSLEEDDNKYEARLKRALISDVSGEEDAIRKITDLDIENASLKAEMAQMKAKKNAELDDLERKLGAAEHENEHLKSAIRTRVPGNDAIEKQISQLTNEREEWKGKFLDLRESHQQMKGRLDQLQDYLRDIPTMEETAANLQELNNLREETKFQKQQLEQLQNKLFNNKKLLSQRDLKIEELQNQMDHLSGKMNGIASELDRIKSDGEGAVLQRCQEEIVRLKEDNQRLAIDFEKAKKLLETSHRKVRHMEVKLQNEQKQSKGRVQQEEETVMALREESRQKDEQMMKMKRALKELGSKNQDLMEQNLIIREQLKHLEYLSTDETQKLQRRFTQEMGLCFSELQSLVNICMQRAEGQDPNMSMLLGVRPPTNEQELDTPVSSDEKQTLRHWLSKLRDLRSEVEKLRGMISNKYAEDMGDNLNCATQ
ncbi:centrosomal protein of 85 kDa-like isoform X1 [Mytilus californianus]|uniref:centrosomal protein of 85 kDa-like isoform X1 n=2 Tax=Mytilus californianus TaxID=6549 RepID=UPI0022454F46|nr:centrosomal protein of 85 kDa-like isoform X1 [Mytilus californianus]